MNLHTTKGLLHERMSFFKIYCEILIFVKNKMVCARSRMRAPASQMCASLATTLYEMHRWNRELLLVVYLIIIN